MSVALPHKDAAEENKALNNYINYNYTHSTQNGQLHKVAMYSRVIHVPYKYAHTNAVLYCTVFTCIQRASTVGATQVEK